MPIRNTPATDAVVDKEEPGAVDNRLSLVPSDFPVTEDWEDGETYDLSDLGKEVKIRQISPGEFEVLPGVANSQETDEGETEAMPMKRRMSGGYKNKAVEMMADEM